MAYDTRPNSVACSSVKHATSNCLLCPTSSYCLVGGIARDEVLRWNSLIQSPTSVAMYKAIFYAGDPTKSIYSVRAGCIKTYTVDHAGNERVRGFHLAGDIVGLDALSGENHAANAVAVIPSQVCRIPKAQLQTLLQDTPALMRRLVERLSHSLGDALALAGDYTADQRVAAFLLNMQQRLNPLSDAPTKLPMPRTDIANYLRLATETVCRVLSRLEQHGLIQSHDRVIHLLKPDELFSLAEPVGICMRPHTLGLAA